MNNNLSIPTILLHWLTGLIFILVLCLGLYMDYLPKSPEKWEIMALHKSFGAIVLVVAVLRLLWRFKEGSITTLATLTRAQAILATSVHHLLLLATILMPLSGAVMSATSGHGIALFGLPIAPKGVEIEWLSSIAHFVHVNAVNIVIVLLLLHIVGAIKHQVMDKDGTLSRMLGNFHNK